jgi:UDP-2,3-diacylglucosamine pyrophosphatase LpxH
MKKNLTLALAMLLAIASFGQSIQSLRITHGPWLQNLTETGVTICWTTNLPAVPGIWMVRARPLQDSLIRNSTDGLVNAGGTLHKVRISGLQAGVKYSYKLQSVELMKLRPYQIYYGDTVNGKEFSFTTQNKLNKTTRFMVVNDIHTNGAKLARFLNSGDAGSQDMVFFNGDIVDNFETEDQLLGPIIDTSVRYYASKVPFVFIRGNHETRGIMSRKLKDYLDFQDNRYYFAFDQGPVHFVILDCGEDKPDNNRYYYGLADYDRYRLQEMEWLKAHVKTAEYRNAPFRVIIIHMPVLAGEKAGYGPNFLAGKFGPVIRDAGADLMIAAHTHQHLWLDASASGLGFPMLINGNANFVTAESTPEKLVLKVTSEQGAPVLSKELIRR